MAQESHAEMGRRVIESDASESESIADSYIDDSYIHPTVIDPMLGPQPTATGTGAGAATLDVRGTDEIPRLNIEGDMRKERDNKLKTALRGGPYGRVSVSKNRHLISPPSVLPLYLICPHFYSVLFS